jgi:hypothetical protein
MTTSRSFIVVNIISALFIFLFTYTAFDKALKITIFKNTLSRSPLIGDWSGFVAWSIVVLEWLTVLLLIYPLLRLIGLWFSFFLMVAFTIYIAVMLLSASHLPCSCGGVLSNISWKNHLYLNCILTLLATVSLKLEKKNRSVVKNRYKNIYCNRSGEAENL